MTDRLVACFEHPEQCLFADISSRRPDFSPIAVYVGFVVENWKFGNFFSPRAFKIPLPVINPSVLYVHFYGLVLYKKAFLRQ
jgi:hypothetical protein